MVTANYVNDEDKRKKGGRRLFFSVSWVEDIIASRIQDGWREYIQKQLFPKSHFLLCLQVRMLRKIGFSSFPSFRIHDSSSLLFVSHKGNWQVQSTRSKEGQYDKKNIKLSTIELGTIATGLDLLLCWLPLRNHDKVEGAEQDQVVVIAEPKFLGHLYYWN